ncbi:MAG: MBL fold metallo-hydrolase [Deltaproteobacteria bacterium]|nr:MBL fold metallo-hydrolase [Deltaproteobacteria bacterium]
MKEQLWQHKEIKIRGVSLAGVYSCYQLPDFNFSIDVGQGFDWILNDHLFFITHGHMDHAAGIPYIISQKNMRHHPKPQFYMPGSLIQPLREIVSLWSQIEQHTYEYDFFALEDFPSIYLNSTLRIKPFRTFHRIDSYGFSLLKKTKTLLPEFQQKTGASLVELKKKGIQIEKEVEKILISFSGDSQIEFLDQNPELYDSQILFMESTFMDNKKSLEDTRRWGHTHLFEILERLPRINSEKILLKHLSSRYSLSRAQQILDEFVDPKNRTRFEVFPGR